MTKEEIVDGLDSILSALDDAFEGEDDVPQGIASRLGQVDKILREAAQSASEMPDDEEDDEEKDKDEDPDEDE